MTSLRERIFCYIILKIMLIYSGIIIIIVKVTNTAPIMEIELASLCIKMSNV